MKKYLFAIVIMFSQVFAADVLVIDIQDVLDMGTFGRNKLFRAASKENVLLDFREFYLNMPPTDYYSYYDDYYKDKRRSARILPSGYEWDILWDLSEGKYHEEGFSCAIGCNIKYVNRSRKYYPPAKYRITPNKSCTEEDPQNNRYYFKGWCFQLTRAGDYRSLAQSKLVKKKKILYNPPEEKWQTQRQEVPERLGAKHTAEIMSLIKKAKELEGL